MVSQTGSIASGLALFQRESKMIQFVVNKQGAELQSLRCIGQEYLWQGDPDYWKRKAPILFPIVGRVTDDILRIDGCEYKMNQHGFARDSEFEQISASYFILRNNGRNDYPYAFELSARYTSQFNSLICEWEVTNCSNRDMHFQIGAHPAFNLPDYNESDEIHGFIQCYDGQGNVINPMVVNHLVDGLRYSYGTPKLINNSKAILPLTNRTFADDAILLEGKQIASATLFDKYGRKVLTVTCPQAEAFGLWAPAKKGCSFVCIEPWCGIANRYNFNGDISEREYNHSLKPNDTYLFSYKVELF